MKILIYGINFTPELTGVGKYTGEMAAWLSSRGHRVRVVTAHPYYPAWKLDRGFVGYRKEIISGVLVWRCPLYVPPRPTGVKRILHLVSFALSSAPILLCQILWAPDIVWVVEPALICAPVGLLVSKISRAKSWLHVQDLEIDAAFSLGLVKSHLMRRVVLNCEKLLMNRFNMVSSISLDMLSMIKRKGVPSKNLILFPNWVDTSMIRPAKSRIESPSLGLVRYRALWNIQENAIVLLYSGNFGEKQGLELVIHAARKMTKRRDIFFVMCGNGVAYDRLRSMADDLPNIRWMPLQPIERLGELLSEADIHLLPQVAGVSNLVMPSKLTGIFASARPVLATAEPGSALHQVIVDANAGLVVEHDNTDAFFAAIVRLAENHSLRYEQGKSARKYAIENMDINPILEKFELHLSVLKG